MLRAPAPSPEAQLAFLVKLQRLFSEGDFTATYKFALLISLTDLAVELGPSDGDELTLSPAQIADRFIQLYWRHVSPYSSGRQGAEAAVLAQNVGKPAAVLTAIAEFRATTGAVTLPQAMAQPSYKKLLSRVAATVSAQPMKYLQNLGGVTDPFLYTRDGSGMVRLKPGVAFCLRRFQPLVQQLARAHWVDHIKANRRNHGILGESGDLEHFLFSASRRALSLMGEGLRKLSGPHCFYCRGRMDTFDVDHYVPFSYYPRDLAHNFVLAHASCNRSKSDALAALPHLERWLERTNKHADDLAEIGQSAGMVADTNTTNRVAAWAYGNSRDSRGQAWVHRAKYEPVNDRYLLMFSR